ncbi:MAG: hypothetical protein QOD92_592 [Acidimicrobiaceae bacterium]
MKVWRAVGLAAALAVAVAGCGGTSKADAVADAGASLSRIHSGTLHLRLELSTGNGDPASRVGFQMDGTFDLAPSGATLPVADLTTTDLSDPAMPTSRFVSTGHDAFIVKGDVGYKLAEEQLASIRIKPDASGSGNGSFGGLDLRQWVVDPVQQPPTSIAGESVDRITGRVDPVAALNGIVDLAGQLGAGQGSSLRVSDSEAEQVRAAAKSSTFEIATGSSDHLLRSMTSRVEFAATPPANNSSNGAVIDGLIKLGQLTLTIELRIERPNSAVSVAPPASTLPISALPKE